MKIYEYMKTGLKILNFQDVDEIDFIYITLKKIWFPSIKLLVRSFRFP